MDTRTMLGTLLAGLLVAAAAAPAVGAAPDAGTPPDVGGAGRAGRGGPPVVRVHDLGTLGGPTSQAVAVNERGQVVGTSLTADGQEHAFLWERGVMRDLGTLPGTSARVRAVNERGQVVGDGVDAAGVSHAVLWDKGRLRDLGIEGYPLDVNARAQVLVQRTVDDLSRTAVWQRGVTTDVGQLSDVYPWTSAADLNDRGWVTGYAPAGPQGVHRGFLWRDGTLLDLGAPKPDGSSYPVGVNDAGQVAAEALMPDDSWRAAVWQDGRWTDLGDLGEGSSPSAINERGVVAGQARARGTLTAVLFRDGQVTDLGALVPGTGSAAADLNDRAQVAGWVDLTPGHRVGALWQDDAAYLLPGLAPDGRSDVRDINDRGQVVGSATTPSGDVHAVLWTTR